MVNLLRPLTRQLLRMFGTGPTLQRDQIQKHLRGTGVAPSDFEARGWLREVRKVFELVEPKEIATAWVGKHCKGMTSDYDQAQFFIGACLDGSGLNAQDTLNNDQFKPHRALKAVLEWYGQQSPLAPVRQAAGRALVLLRASQARYEAKKTQLELLFEGEA